MDFPRTTRPGIRPRLFHLPSRWSEPGLLFESLRCPRRLWPESVPLARPLLRLLLSLLGVGGRVQGGPDRYGTLEVNRGKKYDVVQIHC